MAENDEHAFNLRFSLSTHILAEAWDDEDFEGDEWLNEWEIVIKPGLIRAVFAHLRQFEGWNCHVRSRGLSALDEIEVVMRKEEEKTDR